MPLAPLPTSTVKLIGSSQIITSVFSVVKELMENSLDSGAKHIEIKLDKHGLEKIEVKDDGCGIEKNDVTVMCLPSYTSKILDFSDLDNLSSYGFRGEALSALCNVAQVSVTTKTPEDDIATCYTYDQNGRVVSSKISHITKGTIVTVTDLFKNLPVRKQFVSSSKRAAEELKRVEKVVKSLGMVHPQLRVTLIHNKFLIWQKTSVGSLRQSVMQVVNLGIVKQLHHTIHSSDQVRVEMLVPKRDCDVSSLCFSNFTDAYYLFINNRPVRSKEVEKAVYNKLHEFFGVYVPNKKHPLCVTSLTLPPNGLDVNLEPNKTRVYLKNQEEVLDFVSQCMHLYYGEGKREDDDNLLSSKHVKKQKVEDVPVDKNKLNPKHIDSNGTTDDCQPTYKDNIKYPNETIHLGQGQSSSDTLTCSGESSKQTSDSSNKDEDDMFEKFCLQVETNSNNSSQSISFHEVPVEVEQNTDSESASSKILSIFFPYSNNNQFLSEEASHANDSDISDSPVLQQPNSKPRINPEQEFKGCMNVSSKKMTDCFKKASAISLVATQNQTMDNFVSITTPSLSPEIENHSSSLKQKSSSKYKESEVEELVASNRQEPCSPTLSQWSKGVIVNEDRALVQGPSLLAPRQVTPESPSVSQESTNRSVSSQMGCKEMSAFTKFARKMRKEILEEQPGLSFTKVAQILQVQWRNLDNEEKKKYEQTIKMKKSPTKLKSITAFMSSVPIPSIEFDVNIHSIRQMMEKESIPEDKEDIHLVGRLESSPLWVYSDRRRGVFSLSVPRLLEAVRYHQHLADFSLPSKLLDENVIINPSDLSWAEWELMRGLERSPNGIITDKRFTNNGFVLEIGEGDEEAHLSYVPQNVAYCGTDEVREILNMLLTHGLEASLAQCRPLKVVSFIRSEVMRACSREGASMCPQKVSELLSYWLSHVVPDSQDCIHHRPVSQCLYSQ